MHEDEGRRLMVHMLLTVRLTLVRLIRRRVGRCGDRGGREGRRGGGRKKGGGERDWPSFHFLNSLRLSVFN